MEVSQSMIDRVNQFLDKADVPYGCKRLVGEGRDGLVRALAAQAADA